MAFFRGNGRAMRSFCEDFATTQPSKLCFLLKAGCTFLKKRAKIGGYGKRLIDPRFFPDRRDAVLIEQAYKYGYSSEIPEELAEWTGREELTTYTPEEFIEIIEYLEHALMEMGRWKFAEDFCDPREVDRARKECS